MAYQKLPFINGLRNCFTPISLGEESMILKELAGIQKENLRLKQEVEILKKAMAKFAKK
jgi:transposase